MTSAPILAVVCNSTGSLPCHQKCARWHMRVCCAIFQNVSKRLFKEHANGTPASCATLPSSQPALSWRAVWLLGWVCQKPTKLLQRCALSHASGTCPPAHPDDGMSESELYLFLCAIHIAWLPSISCMLTGELLFSLLALEVLRNIGLSVAKKLQCQAVRCYKALYCDLSFKLQNKQTIAAAEKLL